MYKLHTPFVPRPESRIHGQFDVGTIWAGGLRLHVSVQCLVRKDTRTSDSRNTRDLSNGVANVVACQRRPEEGGCVGVKGMEPVEKGGLPPAGMRDALHQGTLRHCGICACRTNVSLHKKEEQ